MTPAHWGKGNNKEPVGLAKMKLFFNKEGKFKYELNRMKLREEDGIPK